MIQLPAVQRANVSRILGGKAPKARLFRFSRAIRLAGGFSLTGLALLCRDSSALVGRYSNAPLIMPKFASKNGRSARLAGGTTKYDAHHTVLSKTYGALAGLRRELSDSRTRVAEREELLRIFSTCADSQRGWLLLEDYFEKLSLSRKDFGGPDWWPRLMAAQGQARLEEVAILFLRANRPLPIELASHANVARFAELEQAEQEQKKLQELEHWLFPPALAHLEGPRASL